jgi:uncharacterized protein YjbI with pentapeptide repeats
MPTLIVVAKATFDLRNTDRCALSEEQALVTGDVFWEDDVERAVRWDSDLAVVKTQAEWWVTGLWKPSAQRAVTHAVLDVKVGAQHKRVAIFGDRWWSKTMLGGPTPPLPITEVPLSLDRAFGGPKHKLNPYGIGMEPDPTDAEKRVRLPNIELVESPIGSPGDRPKVASMFPIPRAHPSRMALTGTYGGNYMSTRWPYYPVDFQWSHFQAAPLDQRIESFYRGDERIEIDGLHPDHPRIRCRLPGIAPRVFLLPVGAPPGTPLSQVAMVLDTIVIDATEAKAMAVWRGHVDGVQETLDDVGHVFVAHEPVDQHRPPAEYRAWFDRKIAEEDAEEGAFEAAPIPAPPAPPPPAPAEIPAQEPPPPPVPDDDPLLARREQLIAEGVPLEIALELAPKGPPAPPPDPALLAAELEKAITAARSLGQTQLAEALEATRPPPAPPKEPPAPPPHVEPSPPGAREAVEQGLAQGRSFAGTVLIEVDLSGLDFSGRDLTGCALVRCNLRGARFVKATLDGAVLDGSVADGALFDGASMAGAHLDGFSGVQVSFHRARLEDARAERASLPRADFRQVQAARVELISCALADAVFDDAILDEAELSGSDISRARFVDASLVDASLDDGVVARGAQFEGANLKLLRGYRSDFSDAGFKWAKADGARFGRSRLDRANFSFADLAKSDFAESSCLETIFMAIEAPNAVFDRAALVGAKLGRANLLEASFMDANLHHADLRAANLYRAELYRARLEDAQLELANIESTKLERK